MGRDRLPEGRESGAGHRLPRRDIACRGRDIACRGRDIGQDIACRGGDIGQDIVCQGGDIGQDIACRGGDIALGRAGIDPPVDRFTSTTTSEKHQIVE